MRERSRSQRSSKSLQTKGVADLLLAMSNSITFVLTPISQRGRAAQPSKPSKPSRGAASLLLALSGEVSGSEVVNENRNVPAYRRAAA
jgi:hypothetical protein